MVIKITTNNAIIAMHIKINIVHCKNKIHNPLDNNVMTDSAYFQENINEIFHENPLNQIKI